MPTGKPSHDSGIAKVIERQMRNWELARSQRATLPALKRKEVENFVALSREVGARGREVAELVSERLGWPVFDRRLLQTMAGNDQTRQRVYATMDERDLGWLEQMLRVVTQPGFVKNDYFHRLS